MVNQTTSIKEQVTISGQTIVLDSSLKRRRPRKDLSVASTVEKLYTNNKTLANTVNGKIKHNNYLTYLIYAYRHHLGYVFSPDILWHLITSQLSKYIFDNAEQFRGIFNGNKDGSKKEIKIGLHDLENMYLMCDKLVSGLKEEVFFDTSLFEGSFSTTTKESRLNNMVGLLESGSPYYDYVVMYACGFPKVQLQGEVSDFVKIQEKVNALKETFCPAQTIKKTNYRILGKMPTYVKDLSEFFDNTNNVINQIIANYVNPEAEFWKNILRTDRQTQRGYLDLKQQIAEERAKIKTDDDRMEEELLHDYVTGWISELSLNFGYNINTINQRIISKFDFTIKEHPELNGQYTLYSGIFSSNIVEDTLIPEFSHFAIPKQPKESDGIS